MRLDLIGGPQALHAGRRDPGGARHGAATPAPQIGRRRHRLVEHLLHRRHRQPRLAAASRTITQPFQPAARKAPHPPVHRKPRDAQLLGDALLRHTLRAQQNDLGAPAVPHRHCRRTTAPAQFLSFVHRQLDPLPCHNQLPFWHVNDIICTASCNFISETPH